MYICMNYIWHFDAFLFLIHVFTKGIWPESQLIDDPELRDLADSLPLIVLRSRVPATVEKYTGGFSRRKRWADSKPGIKVFSAKPFHI